MFKLIKDGSHQSKIKTWHIMVLLLAVVIAGALAVIYSWQRDQAVATVNGEKITESELYAAMYAQVGQNALEDLITRRLILQEGQRAGFLVSAAEIEEEIKRIVEENFDGDEEQFQQVLEQNEITMETVRSDTKVNLMVRKIAESKIDLTDETLEQYFTANQATFNLPDELRARHILVETAEEAAEIIALLNQGADFAALAEERSLDPASKEQGGDLGFFKPGVMVPAFDEVAFALEIGQISAPVETQFGFHIIEALEKKAGRTVTFAEVKDDVREAIIQEQSGGLIQELITRLRTEAEIVYF